MADVQPFGAQLVAKLPARKMQKDIVEGRAAAERLAESRG